MNFARIGRCLSLIWLYISMKCCFFVIMASQMTMNALNGRIDCGLWLVRGYSTVIGTGSRKKFISNRIYQNLNLFRSTTCLESFFAVKPSKKEHQLLLQILHEFYPGNLLPEVGISDFPHAHRAMNISPYKGPMWNRRLTANPKNWMYKVTKAEKGGS